MADKTDFFVTTRRSMLKFANEIGAKPFLLFQYYLTWENASEGIKPSLQTVADDMGLEPNAVCNLRAKLIKAGWIRYENGEVFITKSFTKNESPTKKPFTKNEDYSQKMNKDSQKMNQSFTKNESPYKDENKEELEVRKKEQKERGRTPAPSENIFVEIYREFYPNRFLPVYQQEIIESRIRDGTVWRNTLEFWTGNNYRAESVEKMCRYYDEQISKQNGANGNGKNGQYLTAREKSANDIEQTGELAEQLLAIGRLQQSKRDLHGERGEIG